MTAIFRFFLIFAVLQLLALCELQGTDYENMFGRRMERDIEGSESGFQLDDDVVAYFDCDTGRKKVEINNTVIGEVLGSAVARYEENGIEGEASSEVPSLSSEDDNDKPSQNPTFAPSTTDELPGYMQETPTEAVTFAPITLIPTPFPTSNRTEVSPDYNTSTATPSIEPILMTGPNVEDEVIDKVTAVRVTASVVFCCILVVGILLYYNYRAPQNKTNGQGYCHRADNYGRFTEDEIVIDMPDSLSVIKRNPLHYDNTPTSQVDYWSTVEKDSYASNCSDPISRAISLDLSSLKYGHIYYYSDDDNKGPLQSCAV